MPYLTLARSTFSSDLEFDAPQIFSPSFDDLSGEEKKKSDQEDRGPAPLKRRSLDLKAD